MIHQLDLDSRNRNLYERCGRHLTLAAACVTMGCIHFMGGPRPGGSDQLTYRRGSTGLQTRDPQPKVSD